MITRRTLLTQIAAAGLLVLLGSTPASAVRYLAFGDSITAGTGDDGPNPGYGRKLENRLRDEEVDIDARVIVETLDLRHTWFFGGGLSNQLRDRDFFRLNLSYRY